MENKDIFEGAKFGDYFEDREGYKYIYHYCEDYNSSDGIVWKYHYLMKEPYYPQMPDGTTFLYAKYDSFVSLNGVGIPSYLKYCKNDEKSQNYIHQIIKKL